jgi:hypothetical protein
MSDMSGRHGPREDAACDRGHLLRGNHGRFAPLHRPHLEAAPPSPLLPPCTPNFDDVVIRANWRSLLFVRLSPGPKFARCDQRVKRHNLIDR